MRGPDWTSNVDHVGFTPNGDRKHLVYFNRYGIPLTVCKSIEVDHAAREEHQTPKMLEADRCAPCYRYRNGGQRR